MIVLLEVLYGWTRGKGRIELNIGHFERPTLGIGYVLLVYEEEEDDDEELSVVQ